MPAENRPQDREPIATCHIPVMPNEIVHWLGEISPSVIVDGTYGGGGHAALLLETLPADQGHLVGLDRDPAVSERVESEQHDPRLNVFLGSYEKAPQALAALELSIADGAVLDLGLSSDQLADPHRGFSFTRASAELDLRFDPESGQSAAQWLAWNKEADIANAIYRYGEERYSRRIAREIVARRRREASVKTVEDLVDVCKRCVPRSKNHDIHPATRTFQALRIAVNRELEVLERLLQRAPDWLVPHGLLGIISFHSLEDRRVKRAFVEDQRLERITRKPLVASEEEQQSNPRSRSAKWRLARRRPDDA